MTCTAAARRLLWLILPTTTTTALSMAPPRDELMARVKKTPYGAQLVKEDAERAEGRGPPLRTAKLRLFDTSEEPRVVLYRDSAAWCPYCQKCWMLLEEKKIPYKVELINMRSYGEKPQSFLEKVPGGFLPAIELDGKVVTESLDIMALLDRTFTTEKNLVPPAGTPEFERVKELLGLERRLFGSWCNYVFRGQGKGAFEKDLRAVNDAIEGPFFTGNDLSIVDLQYVSHIERMSASVAYWKADVLRGNPKYPKINAWFAALEELPSYRASRSDFYTHIRDIPPQYGDGVFEKRTYEHALTGDWHLPLKKTVEVELQPGWETLEPTAGVEASYRLLENFDAVTKFASRPAGSGVGRWSFARPDRAKLADPGASPSQNQQLLDDIATALLVVVEVLLDDVQPSSNHRDALKMKDPKTTSKCLAYLRDRVGVPRDMSFPAARALRSTLNWAIDNLSSSSSSSSG